jgi:hypothetical protein
MLTYADVCSVLRASKARRRPAAQENRSVCQVLYGPAAQP